jgi:NAD(P)-dependent dehydrogenase (short-subunit alcohol dehydrogenase family)
VKDVTFDGKVAVVTGGASGMGRAIALAFAEAGASVVVLDVDVDGGDETASMAVTRGADAVFERTNVAEADEVKAAIDLAVNRFGGLHLAVNAAAIEIEDTLLHECEDDVFDRLVAVNLRGAFLSLKHEIRAMLDTGEGGAIVNIASTNSFRARPRQGGYTATKHGLLGLTRSAAVECAPLGIRINAICPGGIDTPMLRGALERRGRAPEQAVQQMSLLGRFGHVAEIADAALWLCSDRSSFTVGHALAVDAGMLAR